MTAILKVALTKKQTNLKFLYSGASRASMLTITSKASKNTTFTPKKA
eukprot:CAMPEP_0114986102 /NCGR_PEP_ID=MMETSP0216-20121206/8245_1 /TAXON_ID=223996 /ORGANISM="Protocruzia adherens, Strain Boccale" /LENGTH=46 /DNA_ID= /DNA_START= /DNA_END= /DNA_ORIENTATION=